MGMGVNNTYCRYHFVIYANSVFLCCIPESIIMFYVNSLDLAGVESSLLFRNDFQVSLEGSSLLGRLIQGSCGAGQCTTSD